MVLNSKCEDPFCVIAVSSVSVCTLGLFLQGHNFWFSRLRQGCGRHSGTLAGEGQCSQRGRSPELLRRPKVKCHSFKKEISELKTKGVGA